MKLFPDIFLKKAACCKELKPLSVTAAFNTFGLSWLQQLQKQKKNKNQVHGFLKISTLTTFQTYNKQPEGERGGMTIITN